MVLSMGTLKQQVRYVADGSGYHSALAVTTNDHHSRFALGERALELHNSIPELRFRDSK
ncbi:unnamed protein product [Leptidea sinapis]|uniref:Uncharacterized protein n=1 Tax=Leptidea sinapis TaxID=189913 RepID=A0A5E4QBP6_9NEOP|nr:unnamed protein product [Leptidea sinapis]